MTDTVLFANPRANYLAHKTEIDQAIARVLDGGFYILSEEVTAFEWEFAAYLGVRHAIGVGSGTDALHLALRSCGVVPGDAVLTVSHTAVATVSAIELAGATPVLVDIDPATFTMDPNSLEDEIKKHNLARDSAVRVRLKAIIPVHLYGHPADMPAILDIARRFNLYVIEDCAQSHGAALEGQKTGAWGHMAAFSFYPTKNLGALGDGGAVVTDDSDLAERVHLLRQYGWRQRDVSEIVGLNSRLDELQAAILRVKLRALDQENVSRRDIAALYRRLLAEDNIQLPCVRPGAWHVYHVFVIRTSNRDALRAYLSQHNIYTGIHYPLPIHLQPSYRGRLGELGSLPTTERIAKEVLSLPIYPQLENEQVEKVVLRTKQWARHKV